MPDREANDRSLKSIKFLEAYHRLCLRFSRHLRATQGELRVVRFEPTAADVDGARQVHLAIPEAEV